MNAGGPAGGPHRASQPAAEQARKRREEWRSEHAQMAADLTRTVSLLGMVARVEQDVAATLRAMARQDGDEATQRRLKLAEEAIRGARAAVERSEHLQLQAHRWERHAKEVRLHQALRRAGTLLADLAQAERDIAAVLTSLASEDGTGLAAERRRLAQQALAGARRADDRARALHELATTAIPDDQSPSQ